MRILFISFLLLFSLKLFGQDKLVLFNGKEIEATNVNVEGKYLTFYNLNKNPEKLRKMDRWKVFSIKRKEGAEEVIYVPDLRYDDFSVEEMRMFIKGEQDAMKYYKPTAVVIGAAAVGAAASYFTFYGLAAPPIYTTIIGGFSPNVKKQPIEDTSFVENEFYVMGYQKKARDINIRKSLLFGFGGFAVGFAAFAVISNN